MSLWEKKAREYSVIRLIEKVGFKKAVELSGKSVEEFSEGIVDLEYLHDFDKFSRTHLKITDKNGALIPFVQNRPQKIMDEAIERQQLRGKPVRICLLKARQWGGSTKWEGHIFRDSILRAFRSSMIVAHDLESARHLREMFERFYEHYDKRKPQRRKESDKWWKFQHRVDRKSADSHLRIDTADELSTGHSLTLHNLHCSEIQGWRNAAELVKGLFPTVPNSPDTMILMEGTGSGVGDYWYEFCNTARTGDTDWEFLFMPWFVIEEYQTKFDSDDDKLAFEKSLDSEEKLLLADCSLEKLHWRRQKIRSDYKGDLDSFNQQYPSDPDVAFLTSGRPVFHARTVRNRVSESLPGETGSLEWVKTEPDAKRKVEFVVGDGVWTVWERPIKRRIENLYCMGADFSEGKAVIPELGNKGSDFSAARIKRRDTAQYVATLHARLDPDLVAEEMWKACIYFGGREMVGVLPEQNAQGGGELVIRRLKVCDEVWLLKTPVIGKKGDPLKKDEFGWETMKNTKRLAIDTMKEYIRNSSYKDPDKRVWYECSTYVYDEQGRSNAQKGKYDDLVMATALTEQADILMPMVFTEKREFVQIIPRDYDVPQYKHGKDMTYTQREVMEDNYCEYG